MYLYIYVRTALWFIFKKSLNTNTQVYTTWTSQRPKISVHLVHWTQTPHKHAQKFQIVPNVPFGSNVQFWGGDIDVGHALIKFHQFHHFTPLTRIHQHTSMVSILHHGSIWSGFHINGGNWQTHDWVVSLCLTSSHFDPCWCAILWLAAWPSRPPIRQNPRPVPCPLVFLSLASVSDIGTLNLGTSITVGTGC